LSAVRRADPLNREIPIACFVNEHVFFTKHGDLGLVFRLNGVDYESLDHPARKRVARRFEEASRLLDERFHLTQTYFKRRADGFTAPPCANSVAAAAIRRDVERLNAQRDHLYTFDAYAVILATGLVTTRQQKLWPTLSTLSLTHPLQALQSLFWTPSVIRVLDGDLMRAVGTLQHVAGAWQSHLRDSVRLTLVGQEEAYRYFRRLVNHAPAKIAQPMPAHGQHLDYHLGDSEARLYHDHLTIDGQTVRMMAMKEPTGHTFANILEDLQGKVSGEWTACLDWHTLPIPEARARFKDQKTRHFGNSRQAAIGAAKDLSPDHMMRDESAEAHADQTGLALKEMEVNQRRFGECAFTLALMGTDQKALDQAVADAAKVMAGHDGQLVEETYNHGNAWLSMIPGNYRYQMRAMPLTDQNLADMSFLFTLDRGDPVCPYLKAPALAICRTRSSTPYHWNLHVGKVGHGVVVGPTGTGKSYLMNKVVTHLQQYGAFVTVIDIGHSYRQITEAMGGSYLELALDRTIVPMNPFGGTPTPENLDFQQRFLRVLLDGGGQEPLTDHDERALYGAVLGLAEGDFPSAQRKLSRLRYLVPQHLKRRLEPWMAGERYGHFFDHADDELTLSTLQVLELSAMKDVPSVLDPLLFYMLHRVDQKISRWPTVSVCINDEAWRVMQHPRVFDYQQKVMKAGRKEKAAMVMVSQSMKDFGKLEVDIIENCPTKYLLGNPNLDRQKYADHYRLNDIELDTVEGLQTPGEVLIKRAHSSKVIKVEADPISHALYALDEDDAKRRHAA
jgi:type IV secretion system protein VirB4